MTFGDLKKIVERCSSNPGLDDDAKIIIQVNRDGTLYDLSLDRTTSVDFEGPGETLYFFSTGEK